MPEPTPTTRDRQKAKALIESLNWPPSKEQVVTWLMEAAAQARREGREEGRRQYGFQEGQRVGLESAIRELKLVIDDLEKRARPLRRLPDQPAPEAKE